MKNLSKFMKRFHKDEKGVTLVEYGIALILALAVGGVGLTALAGNVNTQLNAAGTCMSTQGAAGSCG